MKYVHLECIFVCNGPQMLECASPRSFVTQSTFIKKISFMLFPLNARCTYSKFFFSSNFSVPIDISCIWCNLLCFMWPNLLCHKLILLLCVMAWLVLTFGLTYVVQHPIYIKHILICPQPTLQHEKNEG